MDTAAFKAEIRLYALECIVAKFIASYFATAFPDPKVAHEKFAQSLLSSARAQGFPGLDPGMSDLASAELEAALNSLLAGHKHYLDKA